MKIYRFFDKKRRHTGKGEKLLKYVYLRDDEFWYRSLRESQSKDQVSENLERIYTSFKELNDKYWKSLRALCLIWALALLVMTGQITEAGAFGVKIFSSNFGIFFLPAAALVSVYHGAIATKRSVISAVFDNHFKISTTSERVNLLTLFPEAFYFFKFIPHPETAPKYLLPTSKYTGVIFFFIFLIILIPFLLIFPVYVVYFFAEKVWISNIASPTILKIVVIFSVAGIFSTYAFPTTAMFRRRYIHMGLINLLNSSMNNDRSRYMRYVSMIDRAHKRMGFKSDG